MRRVLQKVIPHCCRKSLFLLLLAGQLATVCKAQNLLYFVGNGPVGYTFGYFNVETCEVCTDLTGVPISLFPGGVEDAVPLPNGNVAVIGAYGDILVFDPPNPTPLSSFDLPGLIFVRGGVLLPNGNVYVTALEFVAGVPTNRLYEFNPVTNTAVLVGSESSTNFSIGEPFFWGGTLYCFGFDANGEALLSIQVGNPLVFTSIYTYPSFCSGSTATISSGPFAGIYTGVFGTCSGEDLDIFDLPSNTTTFQCAVSSNGYIYGLGEVPNGFPPPPVSCSCTTDAGEIPTPNATLCTNEALVFTNTGGFLDPSDIRQFILFTDLNDPEGSVLLTSNTPSFAFAPPLQTGVTYYVAAIAGNSISGNVDFNDLCFDISNAIEVLWNPTPTVMFSTVQANLCAGECQDIALNFTGTQPFSLSYSDTAGGSQQTQVFTQNTGLLSLCAPLGFTGSLTLQALSLSDANCVCD